MRKYINRDAMEIITSRLFGLGRFLFPQSPQSGWNKRNGKINAGRGWLGMFPNVDKVIDRCVEKGMNKEQIVDFCTGGGCITLKEIEDNFNYYIDKIREREKCWDIKILDFILANYKDKKLFYDSEHPTNVIMKELSLEIMKKIGIENENISCDVRMNYHEEPVYPCVRKALSL